VARSGGIAGYDDEWLIHRDGRAERRRGASAVGPQIDPQTLDRLATTLAALMSLDFRETEATGADYVMYQVDYEGRRLRFNAQTADTRLHPLRDVLEGLFSH